MTITHLRSSLVLFCATLSFATCGYAQTPDAPASTSTTEPGWFTSHWDAAENKIESIYDVDRLSIILSGYAYHNRSTYPESHLHDDNERTWGLGVSKEMRDEKDNEESIQFLAISDSHFQPQISATYTYDWMKPLPGNLEMGLGFKAGLIARPDIYKGIPIPGALPEFSIGTRDTKLLFVYVPKLTGTINGDVLWVTLRCNLK